MPHVCTGWYFIDAFWRAHCGSGWFAIFTLWGGIFGAVALALDQALHLEANLPWARRVPLPARAVTFAVFAVMILWNVGRLVVAVVKEREPVAYNSGVLAEAGAV